MSGSSAMATINLLKSETEIRSKLMAAREADKLDLFGVSILAYFAFRRSSVEGKSALVATSLQKFVGLDWCAEPGAGGRFLPDAAGVPPLKDPFIFIFCSFVTGHFAAPPI